MSRTPALSPLEGTHGIHSLGESLQVSNLRDDVSNLADRFPSVVTIAILAGNCLSSACPEESAHTNHD